MAVLSRDDDVDGRILVVNAGSSSLKLRVLGPDASVVATADLPAPRGTVDAPTVATGPRSPRSAIASSTGGPPTRTRSASTGR